MFASPSGGTVPRIDQELPAELRLRILRTAVLTRRFEERAARLARAGAIPAAIHLGAGQEVGQIAALAALRPDDPMLYGHRGAGYWFARGIPPATVLADIAYREGSTNRGKGGVMHVVDPARGVLGESGTVGGNFVLGAGIAFADRQLGRDTVTIVFFGDGTSNRGQFHEAANFAAIARLPLVLFCENNGWGLSVPASVSTSVDDIATRAAGYGMPGVVVDGCDPDAVFAAVSAAAARARAGEGPTLVEAKVPRIPAHFLGDKEHYRTDADRQAALDRDPLPRLVADVRARGLLDDDGLAALEAEVAAELDAAFDDVLARPLVAPATAFEGLYP
ncbi:MAG: thiamine pyrophosphate-dependent dehydrogenase E1 component subunit alpha [Acidimicrobiales bacterium]|jgi:pyruvate dehydrogenase E1 component alpha subunit|nr:thiamine pyrophosphate-dependent dehydrogenase E1 component subunit alpha [Acidimicrobiales bacterium]